MSVLCRLIGEDWMSEVSKTQVQVGTWAQFKELASPIRQEVFVLEQNVPLEEELDVRDADCVHAVAFSSNGQPIGTGRLLPDGHIGRMSVLRSHRGLGVGGQILKALMEQARMKGFEEVVLSAQTHALGFYQQFGFVAEGEEYLDANIPHLTMRRKFA